MEWHLCRFANCAAKYQDHGNSKHRLIHVHDGRWQLAKVECARANEQDHDTNDKANIAYPVGNEKLR